MSEGGARQVLALSFCLWAAETAAICAVLMAVDCPWDLAMGLSVVGVASLGTLIPTAPAYLGSYQLSYMIALGWYGIAPATAIAAATAVQIGLIGTLTVIGMVLVGTRMVLTASRRPSGSGGSTGRQGL